MFENIISRAKKRNPRIHCITNYVTANDMANIILAAGGSPIMAESAEEASQVTTICDGLVLNLGIPSKKKQTAMEQAGKEACRLGHPVILDPVGIGCSQLRKDITKQLLTKIPCSVIRGNVSEILETAKLYGIQPEKSPVSCGVDADEAFASGEEPSDELCGLLKELSRRSKAVILMTGRTDLAAKEDQVAFIRNGHELMSKIIGTGCMLDGILAVYAAANPQRLWEAAVTAAAAEGLCGELAYKKTRQRAEGTGSFCTYLLDFISLLEEDNWREGSRIEIR